MTNKEAIEHLMELKTLRIEFPNSLQEQALDLAIKALEETTEISKWLDPDIDPELALERIREIVYERGKEQ